MAADIFERLIEDHNRHRELIDQIKETRSDSDDRRKLFEKFKIDASAHANTEEETLYVTIMAVSDTRVDAQHSVKEHAEIGMAFVELDEMDINSSEWMTKFETLAEDYLHHIEEEEEEKFPKSREVIDDAKAVELRDEFNARKPEEIERVKAKTDVPEIKKGIEEEKE